MLKPAQNHSVGALTLFELLVVLGVIAVLASLLLAAFSNAKAKSTRTACLNNLKQINLGLRMYADENGDCLPNTNAVTSAYKELVKTYVGLAAPSSPNDRLFACPSDSFSVDSTQNVRLNGPLHETVLKLLAPLGCP